MSFHHVAITTKDTKANHDFYTKAMGFTLAACEASHAAAGEGGWMKHFFYDTGDGSMMAFWELHVDGYEPDKYRVNIAEGLDLPQWTNHLAFGAKDLDELERFRKRWLDYGCEVQHIDHGWCQSIYTTDPNGITVEFCTFTKPFTEETRRDAEQVAFDPAPPLKSFFRVIEHDD